MTSLTDPPYVETPREEKRMGEDVVRAREILERAIDACEEIPEHKREDAEFLRGNSVVLCGQIRTALARLTTQQGERVTCETCKGVGVVRRETSPVGYAHCSSCCKCKVCVEHYDAPATPQESATPTPHNYWPSVLHMGDCDICGNVADHPLHKNLPPLEEVATRIRARGEAPEIGSAPPAVKPDEALVERVMETIRIHCHGTGDATLAARKAVAVLRPTLPSDERAEVVRVIRDVDAAWKHWRGSSNSSQNQKRYWRSLTSKISEMRQMRDRLASPRPEGEWREMSSAPRDGMHFLAYTWSEGRKAGAYSIVRWDTFYDAFADDLGNELEIEEEHISHWMPLPAPPAARPEGRE